MAHGHWKADVRNWHVHRVALAKLQEHPERLSSVLALLENWLRDENLSHARKWLTQWWEMLTAWPLIEMRAMVLVDNFNTNGFRGLCLDPVDLAVSKLAAGRPKDLDYVGVLLRERLVRARDLLERIGATPSLPPPRQAELTEMAQRLAGVEEW
jgi:hypothetical protein